MSVWTGRVCSVTIVGLGIALLLVAAFGETASSTSIGVVLAMVPWIGVGAFIVATRPSNPIGWLFSAVGLLWLSGEVVYDWALGFTDSSDPLLPYASLYAASYWIPGLGLLFVAVMLFPSGRLPSPGWRPAFVVVVTGLTLAFARAALAVAVQAGDEGLVVDNPLGLSFFGLVTTKDEAPILICLFASAVTAVICFVARFRRSRSVEHQQLKWMALAVPAFVAGWVLAGVFEPWLLVANGLRVVSLTLIPLAAGLAITRFHLYDVDRVISRTTAYALVTGVLLGVYVVVVTSLTSLVPDSGSSGATDSWAVAIATLAAAALFRPVLGVAQRLVDRRFNREQYNAEVAVEVFARELRDEVEPEHVKGSLLGVVNQTVQPSGVALWLRDGPA
jgi:nicotinamide mononucleotide (NMN) deamidase PncC